jgi:hypothetical protein
VNAETPVVVYGDPFTDIVIYLVRCLALQLLVRECVFPTSIISEWLGLRPATLAQSHHLLGIDRLSFRILQILKPLDQQRFIRDQLDCRLACHFSISLCPDLFAKPEVPSNALIHPHQAKEWSTQIDWTNHFAIPSLFETL